MQQAVLTAWKVSVKEDQINAKVQRDKGSKWRKLNKLYLFLPLSH